MYWARQSPIQFVEMHSAESLVRSGARAVATVARIALSAGACPQVELLDEYVDHSDRVLLRHIVVQELGKQNALPAVLTFDEALHLQLRSSVVAILTQPAFSHSLDRPTA